MERTNTLRFIEETITYMDNDLISFRKVLNDGNLKGKLGFAMITSAMAAFDAFAWIIYQKYDLSVNNKALINKLLNDGRFFDKSKYISESVFYGIVRCGAVHQIYPKDSVIVAIIDDVVMYKNNDRLCINCYALYCDVLRGIKAIYEYMKGIQEDIISDYYFKLLLRTKMDIEEIDNCNINLDKLPSLPVT
jgi:hypothetical protein